MQVKNLAAVVLAAGQGTRMKSALPKVLHPLAGRPMIAHVLASLESLAPERIVVVVGPEMEALSAAVKPHATLLQDKRLGTGHAVRIAEEALKDFSGEVLVLYGDTPLITAETLQGLMAAKRDRRAGLAVLGFRAADPGAYGRLLLDAKGNLSRIVEAAEADAATRAVDLCNAGPLLADKALLFELLAEVKNDNKKGEYFLTDIFALAAARGETAAVAMAAEAEVLGVNSRSELAAAEAAMQDRLRRAAMDAGVTLEHPQSVFLQWDTLLEPDVTIEANVVFGPGAVVRGGARVRAFSHIEGAEIRSGAVVGPFARLRPGTQVAEGAHVGNFVEMKNASLGPGAKANHLAYLGDASIGAGANIGAGTITCNYDGFAKHRTDIGEGAFIGSNSALIAPARIGKGAIVAAGSAIGGDVEEDELVLTRAPAKRIKGGARRFRESRANTKKRD